MTERDLGLLACRAVCGMLSDDEQAEAERTLRDAGWRKAERGTWRRQRGADRPAPAAGTIVTDRGRCSVR